MLWVWFRASNSAFLTDELILKIHSRPSNRTLQKKGTCSLNRIKDIKEVKEKGEETEINYCDMYKFTQILKPHNI